MFLSIERWLAVQYPFKYRNTISSLKMKTCVVFIWILGLLTNSPHLVEIKPGNDTKKPCQWSSPNYSRRQLVAFTEISLKFILPSVILVLVLISLYKKFRHQNIQNSVRQNREKQLLRMCAATSFVVLMCWSPNQIYYLLYKFNLVNISTKWHHFTVAIALSTSVINPIIYYVTSLTYRQCLHMFLSKLFRKCKCDVHLTRTYPLENIENVRTNRDIEVFRLQVFHTPLFTYNKENVNNNNQQHVPCLHT